MIRNTIIVISALILGGCVNQSVQPSDDQLSIAPTQPMAQETRSEAPNEGGQGSMNEQAENTATGNTWTITTNKGTITIKLYPQEAPNTVANFASKAQAGYFNNLTFHRVEDWVVQGGHPQGTGMGGGTMPTEINSMPFKTGSVGVARGGDIKVSNDSQFFICTQDCSWLNNQYTNFGEIIEGMDVVESIAIGDKMVSMKVE